MTILIKGMEMPMRCGDCPFYGLESAGHGMFYDFCKGGGFILCSPDNEINQNCPLVPVPTPHGRLIDTDKLEVHDGWLREAEGYSTHITFVYSNAIDLAPTVIEAEEDEG